MSGWSLDHCFCSTGLGNHLIVGYAGPFEILQAFKRQARRSNKHQALGPLRGEGKSLTDLYICLRMAGPCFSEFSTGLLFLVFGLEPQSARWEEIPWAMASQLAQERF